MPEPEPTEHIQLRVTRPCHVTFVNPSKLKASAGRDTTLCGQSSYQLRGRDEAEWGEAWSIISGPSTADSQFSNINLSTATFTPAGGSGTYRLRLEILSEGCPYEADTVDIIFSGKPSIAVSGVSPLCNRAASFTLNYSNPQNAPDRYTIVASGANPMPGFVPVVNQSLTTSPLTVPIPPNTPGGTYNFKIVVSKMGSACVGDSVAFTVTLGTTPARPVVAGQSICSGTTATLTTSCMSGFTPAWYTDSTALTGRVANTSFTTSQLNATTSYFVRCEATQAPAFAQVLVCNSYFAKVTVTVTSVTFTASGTNPTTCAGTDGKIELSGLTTSTQYSVSYTKGMTNIPAANFTSDANGVITIPNLSAGSYTNIVVSQNSCNSTPASASLTDPATPTLTLGTVSAINSGATSFTIPYTGSTGNPTTYSISGVGITALTDAPLPSSPITVNLSAPATVGLVFTLMIKNANGCISATISGAVIVNTALTQACATATFTGIAPIAPTATRAGVGGRGGIHTYTVPAGVTAIRLDARGAKGGRTTFNGGSFSGGKGGRVQGTFAVTPGDVLHILVAGKGGDADGTAPGIETGTEKRTAAGGGGATIVSKGPIGSGTLLLVAGGGGGAGRQGGGDGSNVTQLGGSGAGGGGNVGAGGASVTANGANSTTGDLVELNCGEGGKAAGNGGAAGCANRLGTNGGGYGGGGAGNYSTPNNGAGGGGGAGYTGGGGAGIAGGNPGTSYIDPGATNTQPLGVNQDDNGSVFITVAATISYTGSPFCTSLTATSAPTTTGYTGGTFSSTTGLTIDASTGVINPSTSMPGIYTVTYNRPDLIGCVPVTTTIRITANPTANISYSGTPFCKTASARSVTLVGTSGGTYSSTMGLSINSSTGEITPSTSTAGTYAVAYTIAANGGCAQVQATTSVTINTFGFTFDVLKAGSPYSYVLPLTEGTTFTQLPYPISILATAQCDGGNIGSLKMSLTGTTVSPHERIENNNIYTLYANNGQDVNGKILPPGDYTLTITTYEFMDAGGAVRFGPQELHFTIVAPAQTITLTDPNLSAVCAGSVVQTSFSTTGSFGMGNGFELQLSDSSGTFNTPTVLGTATVAGAISGVIPSSVKGSALYRLRVASTQPVVLSNQSAIAFRVHPSNLTLRSPQDDVTGSNPPTRQASQTITATNQVQPTGQVTYQAGQAVTLLPGFQAKAGSLFQAQIGGCD
jgi:Ig-like domain CHU_C associated